MNPLYDRLVSDIYKVGLPIDFLLTLKDYSKSYYGRYVVESSNIKIYTKDEHGSQLPYKELLETTLHEAVHHYQWKHDKSFVREKGIMHNANFWIKYNECLAKANSMGLLMEEDYAKVQQVELVY